MATLDQVIPNKPIEFCPYFKDGITSQSVKDLPDLEIRGEYALAFCAFLEKSSWREVVESDLQSLCGKKDGAKLLTACLSVNQFNSMLEHAGDQFQSLSDKAKTWISAGCNEVE